METNPIKTQENKLGTKEVEGIVDTVTFQPGSSWHLHIDVSAYIAGSISLKLEDDKDDAIKISIDGVKCDKFTLIIWLLKHKCRVKIWPRIDRYGVATEAEFTSIKSAV